MHAKRSTTGIKILLTFIALVGLGLNLFIVFDAGNGYFGVIKSPTAAAEPTDKPDLEPAPSTEVSAYVEGAKKSILLIHSTSCSDDTKTSMGTGFVVKAGYVVTNAHVVDSAIACGNQVYGRDYTGHDHKLKVVGLPTQQGLVNDIAILSSQEGVLPLPALALADSEAFISGHMGAKVFTLGYGTIDGSRIPESPAMSGIGSLSQFDSTNNMFVTENISMKPGNSGGPLLLESDRRVLGLVCLRFGETYTAATSLIIPMNHVKRFFHDKTGEDL